MRIYAAVARAAHAPFTLEELDVEEPRADEVLVRISGVGICHTDLIARDQFIPIPLPVVLGHEGAGIVERVGSAVTRVKAGDKVVLSFLSCGSCPRCHEGHLTYCQQFSALNYTGARADGSITLRSGNEPVSGSFFGQSSFATYALTHERNAVKVDTQVPLALLGPLGCGIQTGAGSIINSMQCQPGSALVIFGAGTVGLSAVMAAGIRNCAHIIAVDPTPARRAMALELGATHAIDPATGDVVSAIRALLPAGADYAFDTSGNVQVIESGLACLGSHGMLGLVGVPPTPESGATYNIAQLITYGLQIKGIIIGDSNPDTFIPELIAWHEQGRFPFDKLIKTYPLAAINAAIADQHSGACIKPVLLTDA